MNLTEVALALNPAVLAGSTYRRIQRFLAHFLLDFQQIARLVVALVPQKTDLVVTLDRTNWRFGRCQINVLMLGIAYRGLAFPVVWTLLGKAGNSSTDERIELTRRLLRVVEPAQIAALVADREFIGERWLAFARRLSGGCRSGFRRSRACCTSMKWIDERTWRRFITTATCLQEQ